MSVKRCDLQGIRAWAVLAVVSFHFFPVLLPLGYLGVDVFFVLSGFLITFVLEKKPCQVSTYIEFYYKRFKRIFPLALLIAFISLLILSMNDDLKFVKVVTRSGLYSLLFITNYNVRSEAEDYFEEIEHAKDYFTHYWSLSVEIQFYVVAPLLLHVFRPSHPTRLLIYQSIFALASLAFSMWIPPQQSFSSTLCRLYQFLAGSMAFSIGEIHAQTNGEMPMMKRLNLMTLGTLASGAIIVMIVGDFDALLRLSVTVGTACLIFMQSDSIILCHPHLQLLGDASYALYLVHWPVVGLLREWAIIDPLYILTACMLCVALSIALHLTYEKWYLSLSEFCIFALVGVLYLLSFALVFYNSTRTHPKIMELSASEVLLHWKPGCCSDLNETQVQKINKLMDDQVDASFVFPECLPREEKEKINTFEFCNFPVGRGNRSFLMIGNSYGFSIGKLVLEHFKVHYATIGIRTIPYCEPLIQTGRAEIHNAHRKFLEDVERERPDVLFITTRYANPGAPIVGNISDDPLYLYMLNKLSVYERLVSQKVFILNSIPLPSDPAYAERQRKWKNLTIEGYMPEAISIDDAPIQRRNRELARNCAKCVLYDVRSQHLNEKGQFMTHDPISKLRYFDRTVHYTSIGVKLIEPVFAELSKEFNRLLNSTYPENIFELKH